MSTNTLNPMLRWVRLGSRVMAMINMGFALFFALKLMHDLWSLDHTNGLWFWVDVMGLWLMTNWLACSALQLRYGHGQRLDQLLVSMWQAREQQESFDQLVLCMTLGLSFLAFSFAGAAAVTHLYWGSVLLLGLTVVAQIWFMIDWLHPVAAQAHQHPHSC